MKLKQILAAISLLGLTSCEYDNFKAPQSTLSGSIVYEGKTLGVRSDGPQLELWEDGHALRNVIPVHIKYDGTYSAKLFDGQYKLVRKGDSPWLHQSSDTLIINVKGNTKVDVPVIPYFIFSDYSFSKENDKVNVKFTVNKIVDSAPLEVVRVFFGKNILLDNAKLVSQNHRATLYTDATNLNKPFSASVAIPDDLKKEDYVFVRLGVKSTLTGEYLYSPVEKISVK